MNTYKCSSCGKSAAGSDKFCQYCGGKIVENISTQANCPACGSAVSSTDEFCQSCGARMSAKAPQKENFPVCSKCGTEIFADDAFCPTCGERVKKTGAPIPAPVPVPSAQSGNGGKIAIIVLIILLIIALIGAIFILYAPGVSRNRQNSVLTPESSTKATPIPNISVTVPPATPDPMTDMNDPYGYVFPSNSTYISEEYLNTKTRDEVRLILNEIYARHGYTFENIENIRHFGSKAWYVPMNKSMSACEAEFNNYERTNKETIARYEMSRGWR